MFRVSGLRSTFVLEVSGLGHSEHQHEEKSSEYWLAQQSLPYTLNTKPVFFSIWETCKVAVGTQMNYGAMKVEPIQILVT